MSATLDETRTALVADTISFSSVDGPGNRFVVFLQGCNFDCIACHNPQTIPGRASIDDATPTRHSVAELLTAIRRAAPFISGITFSGGEATQQPEFLHDVFAAVRADADLAHLTCLVDSNGACAPETWDRLAPVMDGAMIDLKCLDPELHEEMTGQRNDRVLASIVHLHELDRLHEVRLLLVGGVNDDLGLIQRTGEWLAAVDPGMRVKIIGFRPHGVRPHDPPLAAPTGDTLEAAVRTMRQVARFDLSVVS